MIDIKEATDPGSKTYKRLKRAILRARNGKRQYIKINGTLISMWYSSSPELANCFIRITRCLPGRATAPWQDHAISVPSFNREGYKSSILQILEEVRLAQTEELMEV